MNASGAEPWAAVLAIMALIALTVLNIQKSLRARWSRSADGSRDRIGALGILLLAALLIAALFTAIGLNAPWVRSSTLVEVTFLAMAPALGFAAVLDGLLNRGMPKWKRVGYVAVGLWMVGGSVLIITA